MAIEILDIPANPYIYQTFGSDTNNIPLTQPTEQPFSGSGNIEFYIFDLNNNIISENYNFTDYSILNEGQLPLTNVISSIYVDLEKQAVENELLDGEYITYFNFFTPKIGSFETNLSIKEISGDRKELRFISPLGEDENINNFIEERNTSAGSNSFLYFYLNFGQNKQIIGVNLVSNENGNYIKLYQPLPEEFDINSNFWIVIPSTEPVAYNIKLESESFIADETIGIKGPNFNLDIKDQINNSTNNLSYQDLIQTTLTSSYNQIGNLLQKKELDINIDYNNFSNFIHFSSAKTRLENFFYKVSLIEEYSSSISILDSTNSSEVSSSKAIYESKINSIINNFDGYDYFLYYDSSSYSWPKTTSTKPYLLAKSDSTEVETWLGTTNPDSSLYGGVILSASLYDEKNPNSLYYSIPEYLRNDSNNTQYELFVDMVAQHFDNIWIYYRDVSKKYDADNRLNYGVSKDLVADIIRDFGIKLYQNNFSNDDLYTAFLGLTPNGGLFPFPNITGSLPTPTGFEYIDQFISASNDSIPLDDVNKSLYKRIYHNLPYLLKSKGTIPGLKALITSYGIPDTILRINEFGGKDKININDWDHWQNEFNYSFSTEGTNFMGTQWYLNERWTGLTFPSGEPPKTLQFRFKTEQFPPTNYSQSLWSYQVFGSDINSIVLEYTGSGLASGSYSGSIIDPQYQYATLKYINQNGGSASIYLPFLNNDWWSVMATFDSSSNINLYAGNKIHEGGNNGTTLGFFNSSSVTGSGFDTYSLVTNASAFGRASSINNPAENFSGSFQEVRYYNTFINEDIFKDYIMNPYSIEGNSINSSPNELAFRASLGGELYTGSTSIHPKVTGSWEISQSFFSNSDFIFQSGSFPSFSTVTPTFISNTEYFFSDQPIAGIKNIIGDKIRIENDVIPSGNTLSSFTSLAQTTNVSQSYTPNINYLEVAFSPQNEINEDIVNQIGYFNIGDYIGDPRLRSSSATSYPDLDDLRNDYFEKYTKNYNLKDFVRLIKFFDNSLFKMIKDFVPARTSLASGIVIKQHLLERNKYPQPQLEWENITYSGTLKPQWNDYEEDRVVNTIGGTGGSLEKFNSITNISQSWTESINTISGSILIVQNSQDEFYNGEFSGSNIQVTDGDLNVAFPLSNNSFDYTPVKYSNALYDTSIFSDFTQNQFLNSLTTPSQGQILLLTPYVITSLFPPFSFDLSSKFVKIHKIDNNGVDNSIALGQATKLLFKYSTLTIYNELNILNITEYPNYYLYEVNSLGDNSDNYILNYQVSASRVAPSINITPGNSSALTSLTESIDVLGNFDPANGTLSFLNTPNVTINFSASLLLNSLANGNVNTLTLIKNGDVSDEFAGTTVSSTQFTIDAGNTTVLITGSFYPLNGDNYYLRLFNDTSPSDTSDTRIGSIQLQFTQSTSPSAAENNDLIIEPYITTVNFYNSDDNVLINNVDKYPLSTIYQDVDYSTNILTPTNFNQLLLGTATKAPVQDSNYSSKTYTGIRYDGSKSTSKLLNTWSPGDKGTYGKLPTIESDKVYVAYGDMEGGWPPERMNASSFGIRYLISQDGDVVIPNVSENSLYITQGTFQTGERFRISSKTEGFGDPEWEYRNIIRSGNTIQPILYTQIGSQPGASWASSIELIDIQTTSGSVTSDYQNNGSVSSNNPVRVRNRVLFNPNFNNSTLIGTSTYSVTGDDYSYYQVPLNLIEENVTLYLEGNITFLWSLQSIFTSAQLNSAGFTPQIGIIIFINGTSYSFVQFPFDASQLSSTQYSLSFSFTIPSSDLQENDEISIEYVAEGVNDNWEITPFYGNYSFTQTPLPTAPIIVGTTSSAIWGYYDKTNYPYIITSSNFVSESLAIFYGNPNVKQEDIPSSGFNPITFPWSIKYGDEFRFEGDERFSYTVGPVFGPNETVFTYPYKKITQQRISPTGSIEVHFNSNLPVSASIDSFNLDHFLIRRYTNDASRIIFEGFKPPGSEGPYILTPEYASDKLNKSVDEYISDLTQKGLL